MQQVGDVQSHRDASDGLVPLIKSSVICSRVVTSADLKKVCDSRVFPELERMFWCVVDKLENDERIKLLRFATGCTGIPRNISEMRPRIILMYGGQRTPNCIRLFEASTCFGYLKIPLGLNIDEMLTSLRMSISVSKFWNK